MDSIIDSLINELCVLLDNNGHFEFTKMKTSLDECLSMISNHTDDDVKREKLRHLGNLLEHMHEKVNQIKNNLDFKAGMY